MNARTRTRLVFAVLAPVLAACAVPALAQTESAADTMQILREKVRADKKLIVAENMDLTQSEADAFWPVYEAYQGELEKLGGRMVELIKDYAASYKTMSDAKAKALLGEYLGIEKDRVRLMETYLPKFTKVLPEKKVARYYQIENKIRAAINYGLAERIPLVE